MILKYKDHSLKEYKETEIKQKNKNKNFNIDDVVSAFSNYIDVNLTLNDVIKK